MYQSLIKRTFDFLFALVLIVLLSPLILATTIFLAIANRGKPFFLHRRPGKNEKIFTLYKFKTMRDPKNEEELYLPDGHRITKVGAIVRSTSLDELPQLFNVLMGDMSIVGPRPLWEHYLELYNDFQRQRHTVKPGITGWAQINGRNAISWEKRFELDVWYVNNISFWTDLKILFKTAFKVFKREGVSESGEATMTMFTGTK
ncbi:sugar transferase [Flagellimonas meridianipacifica]|uniref:Lipopolysaccharide/colanic/teichoic acid biosynthesis glycosyltransferase n=1 Tax=Flagellimonas meridianipacifica TaxID=1080225 RepID=A0A2T0MCT6_9FLAO|nr:sugar transferase [Allomuricauda pacifica]PRX55302.1 lipopolysaccharide/colanic/teichoic acid biosynthesis glycosyltransferase [Allomuricauda pacifica]